MGVKILSPKGAIAPTGPWSLGARASDFVFVAGMRGIDPASDGLVEGAEARIRQAFKNMLTIAQSEGATPADCVRLVAYVADMAALRPLVNKVQEEIWAAGLYPPRTILQVSALNQNDIFEVEGTFYAPQKG
jgi:2-iminobutanoate/2-iminopropanoate deaminase